MGWESRILLIFATCGCGGLEGRTVAASGSGPVQRCGEHGRQLGPAVSRHRQRGAGADGWRKPKAICGNHHVFLVRRVREGGFTLRGLVRELAEHGLKVDYRSVWNFVHAERLSLKKNRHR